MSYVRRLSSATISWPHISRRNLFIAVVALLASSAVAISAVSLDPEHLLTPLVVALGSAVGTVIRVRSGRGQRWDLSGVATVVGLLLLPLPAVVCATAAGKFLGELLLRPGVARVVFNASQLTLSYGVAAVVLQLFGGPVDQPRDTIDRLPWVFMAALVALILNTGLTAVVVALHRGGSAWSLWWDFNRSLIPSELGLVATGVLFAFAWLYDPRVLLLLSVPMASVWLSVVRGNALERHARQATRLADAAARLGDAHGPAAVLRIGAEVLVPDCADAVRLVGDGGQVTLIRPNVTPAERDSLSSDLDAPADSPATHRLTLARGTKKLGELTAVIPPDERAAERRELLSQMADRLAAAFDSAYLLEEAAQVHTLRAVDRARSDLLASVSHELHPPLGLMVGYGRLLSEQRHDPARVDALATQLIETGQRVTGLVNDLLDAARLEAGRYSLHRRPTDLRAIATAALEAARTTYPSIDFRLDISTRYTTVDADPARLLQVVANLFSNAVKYGPGDGAIRLLVGDGRDSAILAVEDDGPGIPLADRDRVFEKFHRARTDVPGLGLGLTIARDLVLAHGGEIRVEDSATGGARFVVELPR
jgi:signal transduction histidine kinase